MEEAKTDSRHFRSLHVNTAIKLRSEDLWEEIRTLGAHPPRRSHHSAVVWTDKMLVFGGADMSEGVLGGLWSISIKDVYREQDAWEELRVGPVAPATLCRHTAIIYENSMYLYGGYDNSNTSNDSTFILDIPRNNWTVIRAERGLPPALDSHSAVLYTDESAAWMYVFGGFNLGSRTNDLYSLNLKTSKWKLCGTSENKPKPRCSHSAVVHGNEMFVFGGGDDESNKLDDLWRVDLRTYAWSYVEVIGGVPIARSGHSAVMCKDIMVIFAGSVDATKETNDMYSFDFIRSAWAQIQFEHEIQDPVSATQIEEVKRSKQPRKKGSPGIIRKPASGDASPDRRSTRTAVYEGPPSPLVGRVNGKVPHPRDGHSALVFNNCMLVFGGDRYQMPFNDLYSYSVVEETIKTPLPS
jgi:hypothetical protein